MNSSPKFRINKKVLTAAVILSAYPSFSYAVTAGRVEFAVGAVNAVGTDGRERPLTKGAEIIAGDTIKTLDGRVQARFTDGGFISLQPDTEFKVEDYNYTGKSDGSEKGVFNLLKGGLRAITGAIGHTNRSAYKVNTAVATIGIRGTEYSAQYRNNLLLVRVGNGAVYLLNSAGNLVLYKGQSGQVGSAQERPKQSTAIPSINAAGPKGGSPEQTKEESQQSNNSPYVDGNVRLAGDELCQTGDVSCVDLIAADETVIDELTRLNTLLAGPLSNIPQLNLVNAEAAYTGSQVVTMATGSGPTIGNATFILGVSFSDYSAFANLTVDITGPEYAGDTIFAFASSSPGALTPATGAISSFTGSSNITSGTDTGVFSVNSAQLAPGNISQATANYTFSIPLESPNTPPTINLTGAVVAADTLPLPP
jgi:hypothetical protein